MVLAVVALAGCSPTIAANDGDGAAPMDAGGFASPDPLASDASLGVRASEVFASCGGGAEASCHATGAGGTYLKLGANGDVVDVPSSEDPTMLRVKPGDPTRSYLYAKLLDGDYDGGRMPLGGPYDPRLAPFIATWIDAGAPSP